MVNVLRWFLIGVSFFIISACGGGGGENKTPDKNAIEGSSVEGLVQLGYISGGEVSLYKLSDLNNSIAQTKTIESKDINKAGRFSFKNIELEDNSYYLLTVTGGVDIDADDNGIVDTKPTSLKGVIHAIVSGEELKGNININALTDLAYEKIVNSLHKMSFSEIEEALNKTAKEYLYDVNGDDSIDYKDMIVFNPLKDRDKTKKSYKDILDIYIPQIHANTTQYKKLMAMMYIDSPKIVVENGRLQEVPFTLKTKLFNQPKGLDVKWLINNTQFTSGKKLIDKDGIYKITAKLYQNNKLLKTVDTDIVATTKKEIASVQASTNKDNEIVLTEDVNSSLAGTKIIIPKGALEKNTKIVVKKASINAIPSDNKGVSISDVLVMQPSGLTFDKPVQIRLPYNENLDLNKSNVRIARYSEGGKVDYIAPLYIDKEDHEVVFETKHFTEFSLETTVGFERYKENQTVIQDIENIIGKTKYTNEEWFNILNYKLLDDSLDFTVYDLYLEHKINEKAYYLYNKANTNVKYYAEAYNSIYTDNAEVISSQSRWKEVKKGLELINTISSVGGKLAKGKYKKAAYDTIEHVLGIDLPNNPEEIASWSNPYDPIKLGDDLIKLIDNNSVGNQIKRYFSFRYSLSPSECFNNPDMEGTETNENGWYTSSLIYGEADLIAKKSSPNFWKNVEKLYQRIQKYKTNNFKSSFRNTVINVKQSLDDIAKKEKYENNPTAEFTPYTYSKKRVEINVVSGEEARYYFKINTKGHKEGSFYPRFELRDNNNKLVEKLTPKAYHYNKTGEYTGYFDGVFTFNAPKKQGTYLYSIYFEDDKFTDIIDVSDRLYLKVIVKSPKQKISINKIKASGQFNKDATLYKVMLSPKFDSIAHPPVKVVAIYNGKSYENSLIIPKDDFNDSGLENVVVTVNMSDDYKNTYDMKPYSTTVNIKALLDKALKDRKNNSEEQNIVVPELVVTSSRKITVGETVTFSLDRRNVSDIIRRVFYGSNVRKTIEGNNFIFKVTYNNVGVKFPSVKVKLKDGSSYTLKSKRIFVSKVPDNTNENTNPIANPIQSYTLFSNSSVDILLEVSDEDNDDLTPEYTINPSHGKLVGTGTTITYVPNKDYVGEDSFTYFVKDSKGGISNEATIKLNIIAVAPIENKYVDYIIESTPKDTCKSYNQTGCEALVKRGQTFIKSWTLKNTGNVDLSGLKMQLVNSNTGLKVSLNSPFPRTLKVNEKGTFKLKITVPNDVSPGVHKALYKLVDENGDLYYKSNGKLAYVWYIYKVKENLPKKITLSTTGDGIEGGIFTFDAKLLEPLDKLYNVKLSLGDGKGGWLSPEEMISYENRTDFALARKIPNAGNRVYRVAIFSGNTRISDWIQGSYKVYSKSKIPQNIKFKQTKDGLVISWDPVQGAKSYKLYTTKDGKEDGYLISIEGSPHGSEWLSSTSYLFDAHYFDEQKIWYFLVSADGGPVSKKYKFEWKDVVVDNKYTKYLAGKTLYYLSSENTVKEMQFNDDLTRFNYDLNGTQKEINTKLNDNGLKVGKTNVYLVIKKVNQDYLDVEFDELSDSGVIIETKKKFKLYFDENKVPVVSGDLAKIVVGKTFYQHCKYSSGDIGIINMSFKNNGTLVIEEGNEKGGSSTSVEYKINDNVLLTKQVGDSDYQAHAFTEETNKYIEFEEENGGSTKLYKTYQLAQNAPVDDCGGDDGDGEDAQLVTDLVSGHFNFVDDNGSRVSIPSNVWVRITPQEYQVEGHWTGVNCKIDSNGNFGDECYIHRSEEDMRSKFNSNYKGTYQVVIYQETTGDTHYNREEKGFPYPKNGDDIGYNDWKNATVTIDGDGGQSESTPIDPNLKVSISLSGNTLTAVFNKDMKHIYHTTGAYNPAKSYWTNDRIFNIDFNSYQSGGTITLVATGFITKEGKRLANDVVYTFP